MTTEICLPDKKSQTVIGHNFVEPWKVYFSWDCYQLWLACPRMPLCQLILQVLERNQQQLTLQVLAYCHQPNSIQWLKYLYCHTCYPQTIHKELEEKISKFHERDDSILYASCFDANAGIFEALLTPEDAIFSDELNHASIIDGIRLCKAQKHRYRHKDMAGMVHCHSIYQKAITVIIGTGQ